MRDTTKPDTSLLPRMLQEALRAGTVNLEDQWDLGRSPPALIHDLLAWAQKNPDAPVSSLQQILRACADRVESHQLVRAIGNTTFGSSWYRMLCQKTGTQPSEAQRIESWATAMEKSLRDPRFDRDRVAALLGQAPHANPEAIAACDGWAMRAVENAVAALLRRAPDDPFVAAWLIRSVPRELAWSALLASEEIHAIDAEAGLLDWPPPEAIRDWGGIVKKTLRKISRASPNRVPILVFLRSRTPAIWDREVSRMATMNPVERLRTGWSFDRVHRDDRGRRSDKEARTLSWLDMLERIPEMLGFMPPAAVDALGERLFGGVVLDDAPLSPPAAWPLPLPDADRHRARATAAAHRHILDVVAARRVCEALPEAARTAWMTRVLETTLALAELDAALSTLAGAATPCVDRDWPGLPDDILAPVLVSVLATDGNAARLLQTCPRLASIALKVATQECWHRQPSADASHLSRPTSVQAR